MKKTMLTKIGRVVPLGVAAVSLALLPGRVSASSHMDAPLITLDPAANTTDVYAFLSDDGGNKFLTTALAVYPFEEPGIGPNKYNFDDNVLYEIHVATTNKSRLRRENDVTAGAATITYQFQFSTRYKNVNTILQSYLGVIENVDDASQNLTQTYTVTKVDNRNRRVTRLGSGTVPPNNQGKATKYYNQGDNGDSPAKDGVADAGSLDKYTAQTIVSLTNNYKAFAGQRDDGFYGDINGIFDLLSLRNPGVDAQKGFNLHTIVLNIPLAELGGDMQVVGVYATTSRRAVSVLRDERNFGLARLAKGNPFENKKTPATTQAGRWVQVGRQGNPLFCEALVALKDKDLYNRTKPTSDATLFRKYALNPELATLLNALVFEPDIAGIDTDRTDLVGIFIPDVIKVDLSTSPARVAGGDGFNRLSVFGGDALTSQVQAGLPGFPAGTIPGGWPNGRRFGDDVVDIAVSALASDLRTDPLRIQVAGDNVDGNDISYNRVFPYAATPLNGRVHTHH